MFANRFTALIDACCLVGALGRNTLLSLADSELYRARWSQDILHETHRALIGILDDGDNTAATAKATQHVDAINRAFPEATVEKYNLIQDNLNNCLPDPNDTHVLAAAIKCKASIIVTDNVRDFPTDTLDSYNIERLTADDFIANTIDLNQQKAVLALRDMRMRFEKPELTSEALLLLYEKRGFLLTADILREHVENL